MDQVIDLADLNARSGRPQEALAALEKLKPATTSLYGNIQAQSVKLYAFVQLHDRKSADESLKFLSDHREEALHTYQEALLRADRHDEAARLLISRLADSRLRSAALLAVQQFGGGAVPPPVLQEDRLWHQLLERRDVQAAIARVGTVRTYPFTRPGY